MWVYGDLEPQLMLMMFLLAVLLAFAWPTQSSVVRIGKRRVLAFARRPWTCAILLFGVSLLLSALLSSFRSPLPWIHDEYSYLLASDTFAHGRLTNPTHPFAEHFESFHILSKPSYMSKYPPGNGLFLAAGQWTFGKPIVGSWLALALATVASFWMLRSWTSQRWALIGGMLIAIHASLLHAWGQSYWGGAVAFAGGALVFGGLRRITVSGQIRDALLCGLGLVTLANSRPVEGFLISLPVFATLGIWLFRSPAADLGTKFRRVVVPMAVVGATGLVSMAIYNQTITGSPFEFPYHLHDQTYGASSMLIWKEPPDPAAYNHRRFEQYYVDFARARQLSLRAAETYWINLKNKFLLLWRFFPLGMGICCAAVPLLWPNRWSRGGMLLILLLLGFHSALAASWIFPHYLAPVTALFFVLSVQALRLLHANSRKWIGARVLVRIVLIFAALKLIPLGVSYHKPTRLHPRNVVEQKLLADPQPDLVIVSYSDQYRITDEWVYNRADIDAAPIVWARDMGAEKNANLMEYFNDRKVWRWHLENDENMTMVELETADTIFASTAGLKP
jgi:hypothetical protein